VLWGPGSGVSVEIDGAENKEGERKGDACCEDDLLPVGGFEQKDATEAEAGGHDSDPWDEGIGHNNEHAENGKGSGLMEHLPKRGVVAKGRGVDSIEKVMQNDDRDTEKRENPIRKLH
jgi:hypothetical protein